MSSFRITGTLGLDGTGFHRTLQGAEIATARFANSVRSGINSRLGHFLTAGFLAYAVKATADYADKLIDLAGQTGESVENLQRLDKAAKEHGTTLEALTTFWSRLATARKKAMESPRGAEAQALKNLGVSSQDLSKSSLEITRIIAAKLQSGKNIEAFIPDLRAVGGRGVNELAFLFRDGLDQMYQDTKVMTGQQALALHELKEESMALARSLMVDLVPGILTLVGLFRQLWVAMKQGAEITGGIVSSYWRGMGNLGKYIAGRVTGNGPTWEEVGDDLADYVNLTYKEVSTEVARISAEYKAQLAEEAARRAKILAGLGKTGPVEFPPGAATGSRTAAKLPNDELIRVGNFLGQGRSAVEGLAQRQLKANEETARNTRDTYNALLAMRDSLGITGFNE